MSGKTMKSGTCHQFLPATGVMNELRIVLLGKTGVGKSSCGNAILGQNVFACAASPNSVTKKCESNTKIINGRQVTVVDNPGLFDTDLSQNEIKSEILRCITECAPGPHAFIIVFRVDRYTKHEMEAVKEVTDTFGEEALKHAVVLFTHGDQLPEDQMIEDFVKKNRELQDLVEKCGGRVHVIDNKYWKQQQDGYRSNRVQVEKLLNTIEEMVKENDGQCYSNEILQNVNRAVEAQIVIMRREGNEELIDMNTIRAQARQRVYEKLSENLSPLLMGLAACVFLRALLGFRAGTATAANTESVQLLVAAAARVAFQLLH